MPINGLLIKRVFGQGCGTVIFKKMKKVLLIVSFVCGLVFRVYSETGSSQVVVTDSTGESLVKLFVNSIDTADINSFIAAKGSSLTPLLAAKYPFIADLMPIVMIFVLWFIRRLERSILKNKIHNTILQQSANGYIISNSHKKILNQIIK